MVTNINHMINIQCLVSPRITDNGHYISSSGTRDFSIDQIATRESTVNSALLYTPTSSRYVLSGKSLLAYQKVKVNGV